MALADQTNTFPMWTKGNNPARNQEVRQYSNRSELFYSYGTLIAGFKPGHGYRLTGHWDYSMTTNFYRTQFTGKNMPDTRKAIKSGELEVVSMPELEQWAREV